MKELQLISVLIILFIFWDLSEELKHDIRSDSRCGQDYPTDDGEPARCDPDSIAHCCSGYGWCGGTSDHCTCDDCIDYREIKYNVRYDGRCGGNHPLKNGEPAECKPESTNFCCSASGWCGNTNSHCQCDDCVDYREIKYNIRSDGRCGTGNRLKNGQPAECSPDGEYFCCSEYGWCGNGDSYCTGNGVVDYREIKYGVRRDGRCGPNFLLSNGQPAKCHYDSALFCCSNSGRCGSGSDYCECNGCVDYRELAYAIRSDARCGNGYSTTSGDPPRCDPLTVASCCSSSGWCGSTSAHCTCSDCLDYRDIRYAIRSDTRCGKSYPASDGKPARCDPNSDSFCCSPHGWCGSTSAHCKCDGCIDYRGKLLSSIGPCKEKVKHHCCV
ncbi:Lectin-B [Holothuria leucospilota]|uniref:Lectin-B n=1 Tax=Holothuria leucospilota TaxID=206669 RepID=A0A9Q1HH96_HOLLE|nr:Lectin-B [Holothuria leucospilota]